MTRIALIHALTHSIDPINQAFAKTWSDPILMNLLDDSLSADLARTGGKLDEVMHSRFIRLSDYAIDAGADAILFTCSAFGPCIEAVAKRHGTKPVLKPNEAMIRAAAQSGMKIGLLATFAPTLQSMPSEFPTSVEVTTCLAEGALEALDLGDKQAHDAAAVHAALKLRSQGCELIALAQFSLARSAIAVQAATGLPVLTTVDSAVAELRRRLS